MSETTTTPRWRILAKGFEVQLGVIGALTMRELSSRFGRHNIGYLWIIGEPMMLATAISTLHALGSGTHMTGMHPYAFTLVGYNIFIIFRNIFNRADHLLDHSTYLLYHSIITPFDIVMSKAVAEIVGTIASFFILLGVGIFLGIADVPPRPLYLFLSIFLISWLTIGLAMIVSAYTYDSHFLSRFTHPFSYFMIPMSGAFFTMSFLPEWARQYMAWNPLMTVFELARYGAFEVASDRYLYTTYLIGWCAATTYWGLIALRHVRTRLHVS